eukprot:1158912-Pelagomonas_calceolata.AAC.3
MAALCLGARVPCCGGCSVAAAPGLDAHGDATGAPAAFRDPEAAGPGLLLPGDYAAGPHVLIYVAGCACI